MSDNKPRIPSAMMGEEDGSVLGYMCLTDFEFEVGAASGGNRIFPSEEDLRRHKKCADGCGIAEVRIIGVRVVSEAVWPDDDD